MQRVRVASVPVALAIAFLLTPRVFASGGKKQQRAEMLFARARAISNLEVKGSPPFVLKAKVTLYVADRGHEDGDYYLAWKSPELSREEISFPAYHSVGVVRGRNVWRSSSLSYLPFLFFRLTHALSFPSRLIISAKEKVAKVHTKEISGVAAECVLLSGKLRGLEGFCFDPATGYLIREGTPRGLTTEYADYAAVGRMAFPRTLRVFDGKLLIVEAKVSELTLNPEIRDGTFTPSPGAVPSPVCSEDDIAPPRAVFARAPRYPPSAQQAGEEGTVLLYTDVGTDGIPRGIAVLRSPDLAFSQAALRTVGQWRFAPATCGGTPVEIPINVEVNFRLH
jgi:TonB family protein